MIVLEAYCRHCDRITKGRWVYRIKTQRTMKGPVGIEIKSWLCYACRREARVPDGSAPKGSWYAWDVIQKFLTLYNDGMERSVRSCIEIMSKIHGIKVAWGTANKWIEIYGGVTHNVDPFS